MWGNWFGVTWVGQQSVEIGNNYLRNQSIVVSAPDAGVGVTGGRGRDGGGSLLEVWWRSSTLHPAQLVDHPQDRVGVLGELKIVPIATHDGRGGEVESCCSLVHLLLARNLFYHEDMTGGGKGSLSLSLLSRHKTKEPSVVGINTTEADAFSWKFCKLQAVVVDQDNLGWEDAQQHQGVHLLLHPQPPDAVPDLLQTTLSSKTLWHLDRAQVTNQTLCLSSSDINVVPSCLVSFHTLAQLGEVLREEGGEIFSSQTQLLPPSKVHLVRTLTLL